MASNYTPERGEGAVASGHRDESHEEENDGEVRTIVLPTLAPSISTSVPGRLVSDDL
jgi:hypothetical protein